MSIEIQTFTCSNHMLATARKHLAGGVSSGMRAASKPIPLYFTSGVGSRLTDVDGNEYIDYTLAWGPLILGHSHPAVISAVENQLKKCQLLGAQNELETLVAEKLCRMIPCADLVVFNNTGSESVQVAFRLTRAFTGKQKIIRFEGHYHGWLDNVLIGYRPKGSSAGEGIRELPSEGMSKSALDEVCVLEWNNLHQVEATLRERGGEIAGIIMEPILCNSHCLLPLPGYLEGLRELATRYGVVLIFDEVITGFRVAAGGAQSLFGVTPDLATFGKAVAAGFPLSVVAGRRDIMELIEEHRVVQAGTFNGNPISLAAAYAALSILDADGGAALKRAGTTGESLIVGIRKLAEEEGIPILINGLGSAFHLAFTERRAMHNYRNTLDSDVQARDSFLEAMLRSGVYLLPDGRWYVSAVHTEGDVGNTLDAIRDVFRKEKPNLLPNQRI
jgi:glutamate-1-semialdehyde 2,1-aminomutase